MTDKINIANIALNQCRKAADAVKNMDADFRDVNDDDPNVLIDMIQTRAHSLADAFNALDESAKLGNFPDEWKRK